MIHRPLLEPQFDVLLDGIAGRRRLLILHDRAQGLGDTFQFVRYAPLVKQRGGKVILACQEPLLRLLAG